MTQYHEPDEIIFTGTDWDITLDCETDVSAMTTKQIHFRKPNKRAWYKRAASLVGTDYLKIDVSRADNTAAGEWTFRTYVVSAAGKVHKGTFYTKNIDKDW